MIVIAAGGGGVPVMVDEKGLLVGVEAVVDTDRVACMLAHQINAKILLMIVEDDIQFVHAGININDYSSITGEELGAKLNNTDIGSNMVFRKLKSAHDHIQHGGSQVIITTLEKLKQTLNKESGLWIGEKNAVVDLTDMI